VKRIVEAHGGEIEFAQAEPVGTVFTLRFPLDSKE
jgi:signal transduction histidine kinase